MRATHTQFLAVFLSFCCLSLTAWAEVQNSLTITAPTLYPGDAGSFTASSVSGPAASAIGTKTFTYSGHQKYALGFGDGRYTGSAGGFRYGVSFDAFEVFQSFVSTLFHTVVTSSSTCPGTTTYNWVGIRFRNQNLARGAQDTSATNFYAGGTLVYNTGAAHPLTATSYFDLVGPTSYSASYYMDPTGGGCSGGTFQTTNNGNGLSPTPFDAYGGIYFGTNTFTYLTAGGNPLVMVGFANQTVNAATFSGINKHIFSGIYTSFDAPGTQTRKNIYMVPDSAGTTFALRTADSDSDPTVYTSLGTLACTSIGSPSAGFCSGTLALQGLSGTGKVVCALSTLGSPTIACAGQRADYNWAPISILASVPTRAVLSVSVSPTVAQTANTSSTATITATLRNLSGRAITSIGNPGGGLDLVAPFSNTGAYVGTGGTCTSSLAAYASCNVTITYAPSALGTHLQTFRVAYNNGSGTVNATAALIGTAGLSSVDIDNPRPGHAPNSSHSFTATATYSDGSTQNVTSAVTWASSNSSAATITSGGVASFFQIGSANISATLGSSSKTLATNVLDSSTYFSVLGQVDTDTVGGAANGGFNRPIGTAIVGTKLFLADYYNHRVVVWNTIPTVNGQPQSFSLCQPSLGSLRANNGGIGANRCLEPQTVSSNGTKLAVADAGNSRVLIWNTIPSVQGQSANVVIGQPDFTSRGNGVSSTTLSSYAPGVFLGASKLIVADQNNNRVLIWNTIPTVNNTPASIVLGQPDMTSNTLGYAANQLAAPNGAFTNGTKLYVVDNASSRVLIWNTFPTVNAQPADAALGQADLAHNYPNRNTGVPSSDSLNFPEAVYGDGTKLYVSDLQNNRVLIWNTYPSTSGVPADVVLGQTSFTTSDIGLMWNPSAAISNGSKLFVSDFFRSRILVWNTIPTANGQSQNVILGQRDLNGFYSNDESAQAPDSSRMSAAQAIHSDGQRFMATDPFNSRVLIWSSFPTANKQPANIVLGQNSFTTNTSGCSASAYSFPIASFSTGKKLIVSDLYNARVLIWNTFPTANNQAPSLVLGQSNFTSCSAGGVTSSGFSNPYGIWSDGNKLAIADNGYHRILVWNSFPTVNNQAANLVIGQPDFTSSAAGVSTTALNAPCTVTTAGNRFFTADYGNHRIMAWNTFPTANGQAASYVLGQTDFTSANYTFSNSTFPEVEGIYSDGSRLLATSYAGVALWNSIPTVMNQPFDVLYGQISPLYSNRNLGSSGSYENPTGVFLNYPNGVWSDGAYTFIGDSQNGRILAVAPPSSLYANLAISGGPTYAFGSGSVGVSQTAPAFTVSNSGAQTAQDLGVGTALAAPFYYKGGTYPGTGGTCGTSLAGGASCTLVVSYLPTVSGSWAATPLSLQYHNGNGGAFQTTSINLSGSVTTSNLTISDGPTYNFGTVATSATKAFTITNPGGTKTTAMWSGTAPAAPYTFLGGLYPGTGGTCTTQLNGNSTCTIVISFNPTVSGTFPATVSVNYTDANSTGRTLSVAVTGIK